MKIFANRKIKMLFCSIFICVLIFTFVSAVLMAFEVKNAALYVTISSLCMSVTIVILCLKYFVEQHKIMEDAISQMREYLSGNKRR